MQRFDFDSLDSTNDEARRLLASGTIEDVAVITSRSQTAGRGTRGRSWASPPDAGLYFSYVCRNRADAGVAGALPLTTVYTLAAGVACVDAIQVVTGVRIQIKPINDLQWEGAKLGGILTEVEVQAGRLSSLIVGVGINVHPAERIVAPDALRPVSLADAMRPSLPDEAMTLRLLDCIVANLMAWNERIASGDGGGIESCWLARCVSGANSDAIKAL